MLFQFPQARDDFLVSGLHREVLGTLDVLARALEIILGKRGEYRVECLAKRREVAVVGRRRVWRSRARSSSSVAGGVRGAAFFASDPATGSRFGATW
jgi:hypothetical protein